MGFFKFLLFRGNEESGGRKKKTTTEKQKYKNAKLKKAKNSEKGKSVLKTAVADTGYQLKLGF